MERKISASRSKTLALLGVLTLGIFTLHALTAFDEVQVTQAAYRQCADGIDNDGDGLVDYPQDQGCSNIQDDTEGPSGEGIFLTVSDGKESAAPGELLDYNINLRTDRHENKLTDVRLLLPHQTNFATASNGGYQEGRYVVWKNVQVAPSRGRRLSVAVSLNPHAEQNFLLVAEAQIPGGTRATDTTRVTGNSSNIAGNNNPRIRVSVSDGVTNALREEVLLYTVRVHNPEKFAQTINVRTQVPTQLNILEVTGPHTKDNRKIQWNAITLQPKQSVEYYIKAYVGREVPDYYSITLKVNSGLTTAQDTTTIGARGIVHNSVQLRLDNGLTTVAPLEIVDYTVHIDNPSENLITNLDVNASLPQFTDFIAASEGGFWTGSNIRWENLTIPSFGSRTLQYRVRVRPDALGGHPIRAGVRTAGIEAFDVTYVANTTQTHAPITVPAVEQVPQIQNRSTAIPAPRVSQVQQARPVYIAQANVPLDIQYAHKVNAPYANIVFNNGIGVSHDEPEVRQPIQVTSHTILTKKSDKQEVRPGDTISYSISLQNTTDHVFKHIRIEDIFDNNLVHIGAVEGATVDGSHIVWNIPELQPGTVWEATYKASIDSQAYHGTIIQSSVHANGNGLEAIETNQKVFTSTIGVVTHLPKTGYGMDKLIAGAIALAGLAFTSLKRKFLL